MSLVFFSLISLFFSGELLLGIDLGKVNEVEVYFIDMVEFVK